MIKKIAKQVLRLFAPKLDEKIERLKRDIIEHIFSKSKRMKALFNYVHKENDADKRIKYLDAEHNAAKKELSDIKKLVKKEIASLKKLIKVLKLK